MSIFDRVCKFFEIDVCLSSGLILSEVFSMNAQTMAHAYG